MEDNIFKGKGEKKHKCSFPECKAAFNRPNRLQRHLNLHTNQRPYKCNVDDCDKSYTNLSHLKRHSQIHSPVAKTYKCQHCLSNISTLSNLKRHYKRAHDPDRELYCQECNVEFRKKSCYEEHLSSHDNSSFYNCDKCRKIFKSSTKLRKHLMTHRLKNYTCTIEKCEKMFEKWAEMVKHKRLEHKSEHACPKCNKVFLRKNALRNHCKIHAEDRPALPCPYEQCSRLYYFKRNLNCHIRSAHKGGKFTCDVCQRHVSTKQKLRNHITTMHLTERQPTKSKAPLPRRDLGIPRKSMLSRLTGIRLPPSTETKLLHRLPKALLRDQLTKDDSSYSEEDRSSDVSAKGA
ncbi:PREDICTED: zinc finger protein 501-like [Ceratosolen solmsi marchali]|uniref:Zinc finger protein 501-like n=1 Tax=Ceratosolen solmsi marchali TaxID=326594 RepID=A0AAJ6YPZ7_9HYME|nr:PREDICTED: zinc finger protein 501-like [Ceratosolen solmsi marchali]